MISIKGQNEKKLTMNSFRKIFTAGLMTLTVISMVGIAAPSANAAASAGDLIKMNGTSSVYYLGANGKRYVFPNESTYFSWYKDFSGVVTVPQSEMETYPLAANVTVRPGTKLIKSPSINTVYAVEPGGVLRSIVSEANAQNLWGATWNKQVIDVIDSFFTNYTVGTPLTAGVYPAGQLFKTAGSPDAYVMGTDGKARKFGSEASFLANGYAMDKIVTASASFVMPSAGAVVNGVEDGLADVSQGGGVGSGVVAGTGLSIALASDTPAAATIPQGSPADFLKFNVTASNDGAATINSIKFTATGLGNHTNVDGLTVYVNGARVGNAKDIDSNNEAVMNFSSGIIVPAGQTKSIVVRAKITSGTAQHILGIAKASDVVATGATISGSFPVAGNVMTATIVTVGTLAVDAGNSITSPKLGDKGVTIASVKLTNSNVEDVLVSSITLKRSAGTGEDTNFENVGMYVNGTKVASSLGFASKFVTFTFDTPYLLEKSKEKKFDVKADIIDGAMKTNTISLDNTSDIVAMGKTYSTYSTITGSYAGTSFTINAGDVALAKVNVTTDKVRKDSTNVELGTIKITPNSGKSVELSTFAVSIAFTGTGSSSLENVEVMDKSTGNVYDLALGNIHGPAYKYSNTSVDMTLTSGATREFVVRADVKATAATNSTYIVSIAASDLTIKDLDGNVIDDKTPSSLSFNAVTVQSPALTISTNALSTALNAVVGTSNVSVVSFNLKANSTDALKVTELKIADVSASDINSRVISQVRLYKDGDATPIKALSGNKISSQAVTFDSLAINVPKGESVKYYATIDIVNDSNESGTTTQWEITGYAAEDVTEGEAVYDVVADSNSDGVIAASVLRSARIVTVVGSGSLVVEMDNTNTDTQKDKYEIAGNATGMLAAIKLRAANENVTIEDLRLSILTTATASSTDVNKIFSKIQIIDSDKATVLKETTDVTGETLIEDINLVVPQSSKTIYIKGILNPIGKDMVGVNNANVKFVVKGMVAKGVDSTNTLSLVRIATNGTACSSDQVYMVNTGAAVAISDASKATGVLSSRISAVEFVQNGGGVSMSTSLSGGSNVVAILKVVTDNTANNLNNGDEIKTILDTVKFNVTETEVGAVTYSIEKAGGTDAAMTGVSSSSATISFNIGTSSPTWVNDYKLAKQTTAFYVVRASVAGISATAGASAINIEMSDLDGTNMTWQDSSDAAEKQPLRLGASKASGIKVTN